MNRSDWAFLWAAAWLTSSAPPALAGNGNSPEVNYVLHCQGCHLADGAGVSSGGVPALNGSGYFLRVEGGRAYLIQVPGTSQAPLDDADVAELLNWLLQRFSSESLPPVVSPYTSEEVARARATPPLDIAAWRLELSAEIQRRFGVAP